MITGTGKLLAAVIIILISTTACAGDTDFRIGILAHNKGPIASQSEDGFDVNLAYHSLLSKNTFGWDGFKSSWHLGAVFNSEGNTSYVYSGLLGRHDFGESNWFLEFGGGLAVHNGNIDDYSDDRRRMGSTLLFRAELGLGYQINPNYSLQFVADHISNGEIFAKDHNQGLDTYGIRLIYSF